MTYVKCKYDCDVITNKCLGSKDLKSNQSYLFFYELLYKTLVFFIGMLI